MHGVLWAQSALPFRHNSRLYHQWSLDKTDKADHLCNGPDGKIFLRTNRDLGGVLCGAE